MLCYFGLDYFLRLFFFFFFLMIRRPPISTRTDTLLPYTTLFRLSLVAVDIVCSHQAVKDADMSATVAEPLSYKIPDCHTDRMNHEPNWRDRGRAVEYWLATAFVAGSFVAGLVSAIRYALG